jgi:preprotein translocase subunit SecE
MAAFITRTRDFYLEVVEELKKVTWPDKEELRTATQGIIVFVAIVSAIILVMDFGVRNVLELIMNVFT